MRSLIINVRGTVAGQGSKTMGQAKDGRRFVREAAKGLKPWRDKVQAAAALTARCTDGWDYEAPGVLVEISFAIRRPKKHFVACDPTRQLRDDAPLYCANTPDVDKAARAVLDALTKAEVIADDRRVVRLVATTLYAGPGVGEPGAVIVVTPMELKPGRDNAAVTVP